MAHKKVIFFIADVVPTVDEAAELAQLQSGQFDVFVRNASAAMNFGPRLETCDFVAGSVPDSYSESPVWDGSVGLTETQAIVEDAQVIDTDDGGTVTLTIEDGVITSAVYAAGA